MSPEFVAMMRRHGISGHGASLGYPHYVERRSGRRERTESEPIWQQLSVTVDFFDVGPLGDKPIIILDLNKPLRLGLVGKYDFLINPGTFEHVWNAGQAFFNAFEMVKPDGLLFLHGHFGVLNQGYWSQTKMTLPEFCKINGAEVLEYRIDGNTYDAAVRRGHKNLRVPQENNVR